MSLAQLNVARNLVADNPDQYPEIVRSVIPIGDRPETEIRLWCAQFVSDFFSADTVQLAEKQKFSTEVLDILKFWVLDTNTGVAKLGICILCQIYPYIYTQTMTMGESMRQHWNTTTKLKQRALSRWSINETDSVCVACIKLAQIVVLCQQQIPNGHPVLDSLYLNAEAVGLLDRLLSIFSGIEYKERSTFIVLSASLNACMALAVAVPHLAPRTISHVLMFNLSEREFGTPEEMPLVLKWTDKLFKLALTPFAKGYPQISKYLHGLHSYCTNQSLKRAAEDDLNVSSKRSKLTPKDLPSGSQPLKALYTLAENMMSTFNAKDLQFDLAVSIAAAGLKNVSQESLEEYVGVIRHRLANSEIASIGDQVSQTDVTQSPQSGVPESTHNTIGTDTQSTQHTDSTTDSTAQSTQDTQGTNTGTDDTETAQEEEVEAGPSQAALEVKVPEELKQYDTVFNRLLGKVSVKLISRLTARGLVFKSSAQDLSQRKIYAQLVPEFRTCSEEIVLWLSENYYAQESRDAYFELVSMVVDELIPKLEIQDSKTFIRLLSELPELNRAIIFKMKDMCIDPERSIVGSRTLKFLIMFKPPARTDCLDLVEDLVRDGMESLKSVLTRYRPESDVLK